jgi:exonuclease III
LSKIFLLFLFVITLNAKTFSIATYNVENLFDLNKDDNEYSEFIPNTPSKWNETNFNIKINNLIKVIKDMNVDILALQEIENRELMQLLLKKLPEYKYYSFIKYPDSAIGIGFLSKIEIKENTNLDVKFRTKQFRPILETTFIYENIEFKVFNNHWPSKAVGESYRIKYAKNLQDRISSLPKDYDYILIGDFNSDYNEMQTFKSNQKLNNTRGLTGINQILNTVINNNVFVTYDDILKNEKRVHYNLWLELSNNERFSSKYMEQNVTPDNILLPAALFDSKKISYLPNSFSIFKPNYLYENNLIKRWQIDDEKFFKIHKGEGYSDHLPIYAKFSTNKDDTSPLKSIEETPNNTPTTISDLYTKEKLTTPVVLKNVVVIYKDDEKAIIKKENDRAIFIYSKAKELKLGHSYNLQINQIFNFNGLKEIKEFTVLDELKKVDDFKSLYLDAKNTDIFDFKYENEVITNLKGIVKYSKLYLDDGKIIKLYSHTRNILPKNGETITITNGHLASYKGNMQIILYSTTDFKIGF